MIPKILHQTWKDENIPEYFQQLSQTWKDEHPDWTYVLWTDKSNRELIKQHFPEFIGKYDSYPKAIQRADAVRYFILQKFGGVYVDLDFQCFKNIEGLLDGESCVLGKEPIEHASRFGMEYILCNALMASSRESIFMKDICETMRLMPDEDVLSPLSVLKTTGPFLLTDVYKKHSKKQDIRILDSGYFYPLTMNEVRTAYEDLQPELQIKLDEAYGLHYFWGSW